MTVKGLSERELRMMLTIVETERKAADLTQEKWDSTSAEDYPGSEKELQSERDYSRGVADGIKRIETTISGVLNA